MQVDHVLYVLLLLLVLLFDFRLDAIAGDVKEGGEVVSFDPDGSRSVEVARARQNTLSLLVLAILF